MGGHISVSRAASEILTSMEGERESGERGGGGGGGERILQEEILKY